MTLRKAASGVLALTMLAAVAAPALAQEAPPPPPPAGLAGGPPPPGPAYDTAGGHYYDGCHRDTVNRGTGGAIVGALAGAVVGSQVSGNGHRTDGSLVGGVLGALVGNKVGRDSAACNDGGYAYGYGGGPRPVYRTYYRSYGSPYAGGYVYERRIYRGGPYPAYGYDGYGRHDAYREGYRDGRTDAEQDSDGPARPDGCRTADSSVTLPNGQVQTRTVQVCPDGRGGYAVVD